MKSREWMVVAVWFAVVCFVSCNNDDRVLPITLEYEDVVYDVNNYTLLLSNSVENISLQIKGGDGNYTIENKDNSILSSAHNKKNVSLKPLKPGTTIIIVTDGSGNSYSLTVKVVIPYIADFGDNANCMIFGDNLSVEDKTSLVEDIRSHSLFGGFRMLPYPAQTKAGKFRLYPKDYDGTVYEEFEYVCMGERGASFNPTFIDVQIMYWYVLTSGDEKLCLYVTDYWYTENKIQLRLSMPPAQQYIMDVTARHKEKYPELARAYVLY